MSLLIKNIKELVTCKSSKRSGRDNSARSGKAQSEIGLLKNADIFIDKDKIKFIGNSHELRKFLKKLKIESYDVIDASNKIVMPGFIDSHTHFVFAGSRENEYELRLSGVSYEEIAKRGGGILSTVNALRKTSEVKLMEIAGKKLGKFIRYGTTTVEAKSGYGLDLANETKTLHILNKLNKKNRYNIDIIPTFLGAHAVPPEVSRKKYIEEIKFNMIPFISKQGLAKFIDVFCEKNYFSAGDASDIFEMGRRFGLIPKIHTDQFNSIGGIGSALKYNAYSVDHLEVLTPEDIKKITDYNSKRGSRKIISTILPGVSYFLGIPYAPARKLIEKNNPVALATDFNPGSCMSENLQIIMSLASLNLKMSAEEIINAVTINAAFAVGMENDLGSIETGKQADLLIFDMPSYKYLIYNFGVNNLETVIKKGNVVYNL
jgi:imidazolonepropionase